MEPEKLGKKVIQSRGFVGSKAYIKAKLKKGLTLPKKRTILREGIVIMKRNGKEYIAKASAVIAEARAKERWDEYNTVLEKFSERVRANARRMKEANAKSINL